MIYSVRNSAFSRTRVYELSDAGLGIRQEGRDAVSIPYEAIESIQLKYSGMGWYTCTIRGSEGKFLLTNKHYVRYGEYDDRSEQYAAFLAKLHAGVEPHRASIRFIQGSNAYWWFGVALLVLLPLLSIMAFLLLADGRLQLTINSRSALALAPLALSAIAWPLMKRGRSKPYQPDAIPPDFVPA